MPIEKQSHLTKGALTALAVIPARFASVRFPGKVLAPIHGKPMLAHVYERAVESGVFTDVIVATDDKQVFEAMSIAKIPVEMTSTEHQSGTDRIWEVASRREECDLVFNIQADEPFLPATYLNQLYNAFCSDIEQAVDVMTLVCPFVSLEQWRDPNVVKALPDASGKIQSFTRAAVPFDRDQQIKAIQDITGVAYRHVGVYAYRYAALQRFVAWPETPLERLERLEQLRGLINGLRYGACIVEKAPLGVDTPEDLKALLGQISHI